jgi:PAS domain S-box-containing protein
MGQGGSAIGSAEEAEQTFAQTVLDLAGVIIVALDPSERVILINKMGCRVLGFTEEEILGRSWIETALPERVRGAVMEMFTSVIGGDTEPMERYEYYENPVLTKGGEERLIAWHNTLLHDANGAVVATLSSGEDITERKRAEEALLASQSTLRSFFEGAPLSMGVVELLGDGDFIFLSCNGAAAEVHNRQPAEMEGRRASELIPPENIAFWLDHYREATKQGKPVHTEIARGEGAARRRLSVMVAPIRTAPGARPRFVFVGEDVTEREELRARVAIADRMASLGTLAAGVAHEMKNPLAYVLASLDFAARQAQAIGRLFEARGEGGPPAEIDLLEQSIAQAREGAERVNAIAKDLRTFARAEEDARAAIDVTAVLESSIRMVWHEIRHRARLVRDFGEVPRVLANEARLGQVFINLLVNAAHAIPEQRAAANEIRVIARRDQAGRAVIEVKDTGSGISEEHLGRIFDPFFTTKPAGSGLGLGLSICHGIVTALGGEISAESRVGEGSVLRVTLPPAPAKSDRPQPVKPAPPETPKRRAKILLIDDEPAFRGSIAHLLGLTHDVTAAASAREALDRILGGERFDLLLCDLMMPEMTGIDLYEELHRAAPEQAARMVFLSGGAFTARAQAFLKRVPNAHLEKPFTMEDLHALIGALLG